MNWIMPHAGAVALNWTYLDGSSMTYGIDWSVSQTDSQDLLIIACEAYEVLSQVMYNADYTWDE